MLLNKKRKRRLDGVDQLKTWITIKREEKLQNSDLVMYTGR